MFRDRSEPQRDTTGYVILFTFLILIQFSFGTVYYVSTTGDNDANGLSWEYAFATIQRGVNATSNGDEVIVYSGTYNENVNFNGKNIAVQSMDPEDWDIVENTVIQGTGTTNVVQLGSGASHPILSGLTVTGGTRGVYCMGTGYGDVNYCVITGNSDAGVLLYGTNAVVTNCVIQDNGNQGISIGSASGTFTNNLIYGNDIGISIELYASGNIYNCTIADNTSYGVIKAIPYASATIKNCIIWNWGDDLENCTATYSCISDGDGGTGNISNDPLFVDPNNPDPNKIDFHLSINSPCIDAGDPASEYSNEPEPNGDWINMGCYGNTSEAACTFDTDGDGLSNPWEVRNGLNPNDTDTDGDGMPDGYEVAYSLNPLDLDDIYGDVDQDGYMNYTEYLHDGDPNDPSFENITLTVPRDKNVRTIREAIYWSLDGDEILVLKGEYKENVDFYAKSITIRGTDIQDWNTVQNTILLAEDPNEACVSFASGETQDSVIAGIRITRGLYGISCSNASSPILRNCIVEANTSHEIYVESGSPLIVNNIIGADTASTAGAGIYSTSSEPLTIKNNFIYKNKNNGIVVESANTAGLIRNNTIVYNTGNGVAVDSYAVDPQVINCIFWENSLLDTDGCTATYSCVQDASCVGNPAVTHNLSASPGFFDTNASDYRINRNSPCIDAGDPNGDVSGEYDIEGQNRAARTVDMGADEVCEVHNKTADQWYRTIQDAVDDAVDGDIIEAYEWEYNESIDFKGLSLTLRSLAPEKWSVTECTIINPGDTNKNAVTFHSGEDPNAVIAGFTITGGKNGIYCDSDSSPLIRRCIITSNDQDGITCKTGSPVITHNKIYDNGEDGIHSASGSLPEISFNQISDNAAKGIRISASADTIRIYQNTIVNNEWGIYKDPNSLSLDIANCIIWNNTKSDLTNCFGVYSCISDPNSIGDPNTTHNINDDPLFVDAENCDYHIWSYSPCSSSGDPNIFTLYSQDIDSQPLELLNDQPVMGFDSTIPTYVNSAAPAGGNGESWSTAYQELYLALQDEHAQEIWVAQGTYNPGTTRGSSFTVNAENNPSLIGIYGGFYGTEVLRDQRNPQIYKTCLSGDIDGDDCYQVIHCGKSVIIDGFIIEKGNADGTEGFTSGGGMYIDNCSVTVGNCIFQDNRAAHDGGAVANYWAGSALFMDRCTFLDNESGVWGGAVFSYYGPVTIRNSTFIGNKAVDGGGMAGLGTNYPTYLVNNVFYNNITESAVYATAGGAIINYANVGVYIFNCTMDKNTADYGQSVYNYANCVMTNCILWGTEAGDQFYEPGVGGYAAISCSDIKDFLGEGNNGNMDIDPQFVDDTDDEAVLGPDGIAGTVDDGLRLDFYSSSISPCIDTGDNNIILNNSALFDSNSDGLSDDITISRRIQDGDKDGYEQADMGAYEMPNVWFVDQDENITGDRDGSSWNTAYEELIDALAEARNNSLVGEIWVADGTYFPGYEREHSFDLVANVSLYGGFQGYSAGANAETSRLQRDCMPDSNGTILSGDIDENGILDDDNSYHVVICVGSQNAVLDGFTIEYGNANGTEDYDKVGGGLYNLGLPDDLLYTTIRRCIFRNNKSLTAGGAMINQSACPYIENCLFYDNEAGVSGSAICCFNLAPQTPDDALIIKNCTISENQSDGSLCGAVYLQDCGMQGQNFGAILFLNTILWDNHDDEDNDILIDNSYAEIYFSTWDKITFRGNPGNYNLWFDNYLKTDPLFVNAANRDFHLKSAGGRWDPDIEQWTNEFITSAMVDFGYGKVENEPFPNGGVVNVGYYGNTTQASKSTSNPGILFTIDLYTDDYQQVPDDCKWGLIQCPDCWFGDMDVIRLEEGTYTAKFTCDQYTPYYPPDNGQFTITEGYDYLHPPHKPMAEFAAAGWVAAVATYYDEYGTDHTDKKWTADGINWFIGEHKLPVGQYNIWFEDNVLNQAKPGTITNVTINKGQAANGSPYNVNYRRHTFYVDIEDLSASDSNNGGQYNPFKTIQRAINVMPTDYVVPFTTSYLKTIWVRGNGTIDGINPNIHHYTEYINFGSPYYKTHRLRRSIGYGTLLKVHDTPSSTVPGSISLIGIEFPD